MNEQKIKDYVSGKISEMCDCDKCALNDHQVNHLLDIERYIDSLVD